VDVKPLFLVSGARSADASVLLDERDGDPRVREQQRRGAPADAGADHDGTWIHRSSKCSRRQRMRSRTRSVAEATPSRYGFTARCWPSGLDVSANVVAKPATSPQRKMGQRFGL